MKNEDVPLVEAIFELRWGQKSFGVFDYSPEEQQLFAMQISSSAAAKGFIFTELANPQMQHFLLPPMMVSHRFRKQQGKWPCIQIGLGIFTVNQINDGYEWKSFKETIEEALHIFNSANQQKLDSIKDTLTLVLRYQDAFYPDSSIPTQKFVNEHLNINMKMSDEFFGHENIETHIEAVNVNLMTSISAPKGMISVILANAVMNDKPGLLLETIVESEMKNITSENIQIDNILSWVEEAHKIQQHSFKTLVKESAYKC